MQQSTPQQVIGLARLRSQGAAEQADLEIEVVWENQRKKLGGNFQAESLNASDPKPWVHHHTGKTIQSKDELTLSEDGSAPWDPNAGSGWKWASEWVIDTKEGVTDSQVWPHDV